MTPMQCGDFKAFSIEYKLWNSTTKKLSKHRNYQETACCILSYTHANTIDLSDFICYILLTK